MDLPPCAGYAAAVDEGTKTGAEAPVFRVRRVHFHERGENLLRIFAAPLGWEWYFDLHGSRVLVKARDKSTIAIT